MTLRYTLRSVTFLSFISACDSPSTETPRSETIPTLETVSTCDAKTIMRDDTQRAIDKAKTYLDAAPRTVTADIAPRSAGGQNDFHS